MARALVVGASRGLGREFAKQYCEAGWTVCATHRAPGDADPLRALGAQPIRLDVLDLDAAHALSAALDATSGDGASLDLAIVNAGIHGPRQVRVDHPPSNADFDAVMHTNVLGPLRLLGTLAERLEPAAGTLALVTSRMGSISAAGTPNSLLYRLSKAAENMLAKVAHIELAPRGVRVVALHPGWVRTDMGGPEADVDSETSIAGMRRVLADAAAYPSGGFYDFRGEAIAW